MIDKTYVYALRDVLTYAERYVEREREEIEAEHRDSIFAKSAQSHRYAALKRANVIIAKFESEHDI